LNFKKKSDEAAKQNYAHQQKTYVIFWTNSSAMRISFAFSKTFFGDNLTTRF